ncbi:MAG: hypothetical protein CMJ32_02495 [Phycisphaerae bacterium]|nr:hypothetical protein [Phycisphaerae bacterium]
MAGQDRSGRIFVICFIIVLVASLVGTGIFGAFVVSDVREQARSTDSALRSVAWTMLVHATEDEGRFPTSQEQLLQTRPSEQITLPESAGSDIPSSMEQALQGLPWMPLDEATESINITYATDPTLAPVLGTDGRPSGLGTIELVNSWLLQLREASSG